MAPPPPPVEYEFIGHYPVYYLDYLDGLTRHTLHAFPGHSYVILAANTRLGLTIPPDDGRWLGGPPGPGDEGRLLARLTARLRAHIHKSRRRSGYRKPPGGSR